MLKFWTTINAAEDEPLKYRETITDWTSVSSKDAAARLDTNYIFFYRGRAQAFGCSVLA